MGSLTITYFLTQSLSKTAFVSYYYYCCYYYYYYYYCRFLLNRSFFRRSLPVRPKVSGRVAFRDCRCDAIFYTLNVLPVNQPTLSTPTRQKSVRALYRVVGGGLISYTVKQHCSILSSQCRPIQRSADAAAGCR